MTFRNFTITILSALLLSNTAIVSANTHDILVEQHLTAHQQLNTSIPSQGSPHQRWAVTFDNDVLVPGQRDQDYTYGVNINFSGNKSRKHWSSLHTPLNWLDKALELDGDRSYNIEYGLFGFTPEDITVATPQSGDRPYASLVYTSSTNGYHNFSSQVAWSSTLSVGLLGTAWVGALQKDVHELTDGDQPAGWDTQISDGGELTARYVIARQSLIGSPNEYSETKSTVQASIGYITEASWSLSSRLGKIHTPWDSFNPEQASYGEKASPNTNSKLHEHYFWWGISLKARAYNAFLQGQFRSNVLAYDRKEMEYLLAEAWAGYTLVLPEGYRFSYSLRGHTSELKQGKGDRAVIWGGVQLAKTLG